MTAIGLKPRNRRSAEALLRRISTLVAQRQELRAHPENTAGLEENRLEIVRCQCELNHALIERYGHRAA